MVRRAGDGALERSVASPVGMPVRMRRTRSTGEPMGRGKSERLRQRIIRRLLSRSPKRKTAKKTPHHTSSSP